MIATHEYMVSSPSKARYVTWGCLKDVHNVDPSFESPCMCMGKS